MASPTQWIWVWVISGSWWWDREAWCAVLRGVAKSQTQLSDWTAWLMKQVSCDLTALSALRDDSLLVLHFCMSWKKKYWLYSTPDFSFQGCCIVGIFRKEKEQLPLQIGEGCLLIKCNERSLYSPMSSVLPIHYKIFEFPKPGGQREWSAFITQTTVCTGIIASSCPGNQHKGWYSDYCCGREKERASDKGQNPENLEAHL